MLLIDTGTRIEARASFEQRHALKSAGFRWDPTGKAWWTTKESGGVERLERMGIDIDLHMDDAQPDLIIPESWENHPSGALDGPTDIPCPPDLEYLPFQRGGIAFARNRQGVLFADDMGLGKTIQAIGAINDEPAIRVLVVCPASLKINWQRELDKWLNYYLPVTIIEGTKRKIPQGRGITIINYDLLRFYHDQLTSDPYDVLIADECQHLRNPKAKRTRCLLGDMTRNPVPATRRIFISGTPLESRPVELWPVIHFLWPEIFPSWDRFVIRYCAARQTSYGWDTRGASHTAELQAVLRNAGMIRRRKDDVLKDLPPKIRHEVALPIPDPKSARAIEAHRAAWESVQAQVRTLEASGSDRESILIATAAARSKLRDLAVATSTAKLPLALEFLDDATAQGKVVCFAVHHAIIDKIKAHFGDRAVTVTGKVTGQARQNAVDRFQSDPEISLFIGQMQAAGVGLTLHAAAHVVFVEFDWRPGMLTQAEDRCHRIGQRDSVLVSYLVIDGSLDQIQLATVRRKAGVVASVLDR